MTRARRWAGDKWRRTITGTSFMPSFSAASRRACPAMISSSTPTRIGFVKPELADGSCDVGDLVPAVRARVIGPRNESFDGPEFDLDVDVWPRHCCRRFLSQARL